MPISFRDGDQDEKGEKGIAWAGNLSLVVGPASAFGPAQLPLPALRW